MEINRDSKFNWAKFNVQMPECTTGRQKLLDVKLNSEQIRTEYKLFLDTKYELSILCSFLQ